MHPKAAENSTDTLLTTEQVFKCIKSRKLRYWHVMRITHDNIEVMTRLVEGVGNRRRQRISRNDKISVNCPAGI